MRKCLYALMFFIAAAHASAGASAEQDALLAGHWSLDLGASIDNMSTSDVLSLYPAGSQALPNYNTFVGYSLQARYHLSDALYLGAAFDTFDKGFEISTTTSAGTNTEDYAWNAMAPQALVGWSFYRAPGRFLAAQAGLGWLWLYNSTYTLSSPGGQVSGNYSGSGPALTACLTGTWFLIPSVGLDMSLGYRWAEALSVSAGPGVPAPSSIDFSCPLFRLGLSLNWGMADPWGTWGEEAPAVSPAMAPQPDRAPAAETIAAPAADPLALSPTAQP
jgi:hypothetical protein